jgi:hypothetical protein
MRRILLSLLLSVVFCAQSRAQGNSGSFTRAEVFGGYSYANIDTNGLSPRQSASGWNASVLGNFNRYFGVEGDFAGYYKTYDFNVVIPQLTVNIHVNVHDYSYFAGPRFTYGPIFVHALVGGDHLTGSAFGLSASQDSLAGAFGGGFEWPVHRNWAFRASGDYVFTRHDLLSITSFTQNNFRASVGVVYRFGSRAQGRKAHAEPTAAPAPVHEEVRVAETSDAALLGTSGYSVESGYRIVSVKPDSPAAQAFLKTGDIIVKVDGRDVHTSRDVEAAIAGNTSGSIRLSLLIRTDAMGFVQSEREVKIR